MIQIWIYIVFLFIWFYLEPTGVIFCSRHFGGYKFGAGNPGIRECTDISLAQSNYDDVWWLQAYSSESNKNLKQIQIALAD